MITKAHALFSLRPEGGWICEGDNVTWDSSITDIPTPEEIEQEIAKLKYEEEVNVYQTERADAYPSYAEQFDQIFHEGVDAWKATIQAVKDAHPKQTIDETELASRKAQALFDYQLVEYKKAVARLDQYQVALGREEVTEMQDGIEVVIVSAIEPVEATVELTIYPEEPMSDEEPTVETIENPLITKDKEERAAAQDVIDNTPQDVIDAV